MTNEAFNRVLNFMLLYDIITPQQYEELYKKAIPYLRTEREED